MKFNIFWLLGVCAIICTLSNFPTAKALLGQTVQRAETGVFPFIVAFRHINLRNPVAVNNHLCTASLITRSLVVGSATCIENRLKNETNVVVGSTDLRTGNLHTILWWITHDEWAHFRRRPIVSEDNDISVTKLYQPVHADITPGIISSLTSELLQRSDVSLAGWGLANRNVIQPHLLTANLKILSHTVCEESLTIILGYRYILDNKYLCTVGEPPVIMHHGDLGGPLMYLRMIVGINKGTRPFPIEDLNPHNINIHLSIDYYRFFIRDVVRSTFIWN